MLPYKTFVLLALLIRSAASQDAAAPAPEVKPLRAAYLVLAADDFIVNVYLNGKPVPDSKRSLLVERFGATVERVEVQVHRGDWLVFNVVNNRLRWGGCRYFGVAGCFAKNEFGFVSDRASRQWSACDSPGDSARFIARKTFMDRSRVQIVENPWSEGDGLMREYAGADWSGSPVWGKDRNTWIKVVVE